MSADKPGLLRRLDRSPFRPRRRVIRAIIGLTVLAGLLMAPAGATPAGAAPAAFTTSGPATTSGPTPTSGPATTAPPGRAVASLTTSVLSVRRLPTFVASSVATAHLDMSLTKILANPALHQAGTGSCLQVTQDGRTLFSAQPAQELLPASNLKLFTATAALDKLGPDSRITTPVEADHPPVGGVISGNLYLVGAGDPILRTPDFVASLTDPEAIYTSLDTLAAQVRAAGVTRISGSVVVDETRYDAQRVVATWRPSYLAEGVVGPLSAVDVDDGFASFGGGRDVASPQPAVQAATRLQSALRAAGVQVGGPAVTGTAPAGAVTVTSIASPPLADVLGAVLRTSDDTGAELITKELGRRFGTGGGTTVAGVAVVRADLAADGLPIAQLQAVDGSGLDRSDRASCPLVVAALTRAGSTSDLASTLPVAGRTGTLFRRMVNTPAAGRVIAKTGTLDDVSALSGFVLAPGTPLPAGPPLTTPPIPVAPTTTPPIPVAPTTSPSTTPGPAAYSRSPLTFSLIQNGVPAYTTGEVIGDQIGVALAAYPSGPDPAMLGPLPVTTSTEVRP
ncbi:MAG: D-alanyl-D-alanine carboxypeptidase [Actinomycetota bacterium]|nr:D-alanyl-D-alanine carboxypeptidase [Actinomycetota bacterium]